MSSIFNTKSVHFCIIIGDLLIREDIHFTGKSDLNGTTLQFTLTCISTGGPATNVTWTRDSEEVIEGSVTELSDREIARYTHTLTVTGRLEGLYQCNVFNNKPSNASAKLLVQGL